MHRNLAVANEILATVCTIWTATGQNPCFLAAVQKHGADTPESPETLTKEEERATFRGMMAKWKKIERETGGKLIFLTILTKI